MDIKKKEQSIKKAGQAKATKKKPSPSSGRQERILTPKKVADAYKPIAFEHRPEGQPKVEPSVKRADLKRAFILQELLFSKPLALRRRK